MKEFLEEVSVSEFLKKETHEDICVVCIENNQWSVLYMLEFWENAPAFAENEPFRILRYGGTQWTLDKKLIKSEGLIPAIVQRQGEICGGIYFEGEEKRDEKIKESLLRMVWAKSLGKYQIGTVINNDLFRSSVDEIPDGFYVLEF